MQQNGLSLTEVLLVSMIGLFILAFGVIFIFVIHQRRMIEKDIFQQQSELLHQKELLRSSIDSQEKERNRIAHDLHDEIGALLTTSRLYFNQLGTNDTDHHVQHIVVKMNVLFDEMMANIRRISRDLRPVILENLGLVEAIASLQEKLTECGLGFYFHHHIPFQIKKEAELILFRVVQELTGNTLKHAHASTIVLEMNVRKNRLLFSYKDDGKGFSDSGVVPGLGMRSIESRTAVLDGTMEFMKAARGIHLVLDFDVDKLKENE